MENPRLKFDIPHWEGVLTHPAVVAVFLAALCLGLHHSALSGGWRYDDGAHLYFAALYSPWQYFFVPEIMRIQSWAHITPWNAFFYEIGLPLFGLNPAGHYAHLLLILWSTAVATFFLLRLWLTSLSALMGAILFLAMPATGAIGQMLMTGHYAYGLLFSVLVFYFFARGVRENRIYFSLVAAGFYALACWSKELYVPIIAILIFLPESNLKERLRHLWPVTSVAITYTVVRLHVLHGIGGYGRPPISGTLAVGDILVGLFSSLLGSGWIGLLIVAYIGISIFIVIWVRKPQSNLLFLLSGFVVNFIPIFPMLQGGFGDTVSTRLLFFVSWSLAVLMAWLSNPSKIHTITLSLIVVALAFSQHTVTVQIASNAKIMEEQNRFMMEKSEESMLLPFHFDNLTKLDSIRNVNMIMSLHESPTLLRNEDELIELGVESGSRVYQFDEQCQCILKMGEERYREHVSNFFSRLAAGADQSLSVTLEIENRGIRKLMRWKFSGAEGYFTLYIQEYGRVPLPPEGDVFIGLDITVANATKEDIHFYVHLTSPEGWIARSPLLKINLAISNLVSWSGKSAVDWSMTETEIKF